MAEPKETPPAAPEHTKTRGRHKGSHNRQFSDPWAKSIYPRRYGPKPGAPNAGSPKGRIGPRLKKALRGMIENGMTFSDAAACSGMSVSGIEKAVKKPHVQFLMAELEQSVKLQDRHVNYGLLRTLRDDKAITPYVRSDLAKFLHAKYEPDSGGGSGHSNAPVVIIRFGSPEQPQPIDITPKPGVIEGEAERVGFDENQPKVNVTRVSD